MAGKKITSLDADNTPQLTDTVVYHNGVSAVRTTWQKISDLIGGGGGGVWGAITGTLTDQTDLVTALGLKEDTANKNASGGYVGLSGYSIQFKNAANTYTSLFANTNTAARTYTFQDRNGTIADDTDLATKKTDSMSTARILGRTTAGTGAIEEISIGSGLSLSAGSLSASITVALSALVAATGSNTINNVAYAQEWQWNSLASGSGFKLSAATTAAASSTQKLFEVALSGANATSAQTTYAGYFTNTHTGTTSVNVALYASASGGATNYPLILAYDASNYYSTAVSSTGGVTFDAIGSGAGFTFSDNVGIGIAANVNFAFQVFGSGTAGAVSFGRTNGSGINFKLGTGTAGIAEISTDYFGSGTEGNLHLATYSGSGNAKGITIDTTGKVGIGVITPSALIHGISTTEQLRLGYNSTNYFNIVVASTAVATFDLTASSGTPYFNFAKDIKLNTVGKGLYIKEGTDATMGRATLIGGTIVVLTSKVTANSEIFITSNVDGGTNGFVRVSARTAGTSFTITSSSATDTSTVSWIIVEPA